MLSLANVSRLSGPVSLLLFLSKNVSCGPCDIYKLGGTPCTAAHSTTRALFDDYTGPLYQVERASDGDTMDIVPSFPGGVANGRDQERFCHQTTCLISIIYDQSGHTNHLTQAPPGGAASGPEEDGYDSLSNAVNAPVKVDDEKVYGVFVSPGTGYRNNNAKGTAIGDAAQGIYAVVDGTHYNSGCCFDYGNAEPSNLDTGNGHMEAIYFGTGGDGGSGNGPWIQADLENGLFPGSERTNANNPPITSRFTTAIVKGEPGHWAIRGGNAVRGFLSTIFDGPRPNEPGYNPMSKEGAIILGIGGDNSNRGQGTFYEGAITDGYPSDFIENLVQADIVAAKYSII
jgi:hypothetical protein